LPLELLVVTDTVSLALVIHNHQPVGNFGWVIADAYDHAYLPMIEALERHPGVRLGLHYTGPLLQWMAANRPDSVARIRALVDRGQIEVLGGGFYEPILVTLPDRDRRGQLVRMRDEIEAIFGRRPQGAWLAERVWEPGLAYDIAAAGYHWTVLDDNHLRGASIPEDGMWTPFNTDDRGLRLTVFGTEQGLRYRIPFKPVDDLIEYVRARTTPDGRFIGTMGDDGEKFGSWPGTYEYCWGRDHWVDRCFDALEANSSWLTTITPSNWLAVKPPTGRAYFPTASYVEMTEWVLPPDENPVFTKLLDDARAKGDPSARYLRGGMWRNYAARYREINELHKQMLRTSEKVDSMPAGDDLATARDHLYQGQSNDCYWHGLFGGIYIVHMRMATLSHLIAAEDLADAAMAAAGTRTWGARLADTDLDAVDEVLVTTPGQTLVIDLADGASLSSWDLRASRVALASVLRRRYEAYHRLLVAGEEHGGHDEAGEKPASDGPRTIHDIVTSKEPGLAELLHYDLHERRSGVVHLLPSRTPAGSEPFVKVTYEELGDFEEGGYALDEMTDDLVTAHHAGTIRTGGVDHPIEVVKTYRISGTRLEPVLELTVGVADRSAGGRPVAVDLAVEWNLNLLGGGHNPSAWYETPDGARSHHDVAGELASSDLIAFGNDYEGVRIDATAQPAAALSWYPVETVSNSEAGFERVYQGSSLLFRWPRELIPGASETRTMRFEVRQSIDRAETGRA
jgi:4-alpha-glucanotransferase